MNGRFSIVRRVVTLALGAALIAGLAVPASAQHRARLSKDLAAELASPTRAALQVIVEGDGARVKKLAARYGFRVTKLVDGGAVVEGSANQFDAAAGDPEIARLSLDAEVRGQMAVTRETIGANLVYGNFVADGGFTGNGVVVAVIDSGVDAANPAAAGKVVESVDFTATGNDDLFGHGTHLTSVIAGNELGGDYGGVAPGARIVSLKVLKADGSGNTSDVIRALRWVRDNARRLNIRVVNVSLGHPVFLPVVRGRPAGAGRAEDHRRGPGGGGLGRQLRQGDHRRQGRARVWRHLVAGQPAGRHHRGRAQHQGHRAPVRR